MPQQEEKGSEVKTVRFYIDITVRADTNEEAESQAVDQLSDFLQEIRARDMSREVRPANQGEIEQLKEYEAECANDEEE